MNICAVNGKYPESLQAHGWRWCPRWYPTLLTSLFEEETPTIQTSSTHFLEVTSLRLLHLSFSEFTFSFTFLLGKSLWSKMSEMKPNESAAAAEDSADEKDWAAAKAHYENLKSKIPRPVSSLSLFFTLLRSLQLLFSMLCFLKCTYQAVSCILTSLPSSSPAQTSVCCHHRCVLAHSLRHGGREEDLSGTGAGEVCGLSGGAWGRPSETRSSFPLREGNYWIKRWSRGLLTCCCRSQGVVLKCISVETLQIRKSVFTKSNIHLW